MAAFNGNITKQRKFQKTKGGFESGMSRNLRKYLRFFPTNRRTRRREWRSAAPTPRKIKHLQKFPNFTGMKILMSGTTFIHVTKANLAGKSPNLTKICRKPYKVWSSIRLPYLLRCLNKPLGFVPGLKRSLMTVVVVVRTF